MVVYQLNMKIAHSMKNNLGGIDRILGETQVEDMQTRHVLEKQFVSSLTTGSTTPDVLNKKIFELGNVGAITVTDFINGAPGQRIYILGDGFTTIQHGILIFTSTGANKLLVANTVYTFTFFPIAGPPKSHKWIEDADANSGGGGGIVDFASVIRPVGSDVVISSTTYSVIHASLDLTINASVGDIIFINFAALWGNQAPQSGIDVATRVGGIDINFVAIADPWGWEGWRGLPISTLIPFGSIISYTVVLSDISAGTVTFRPVAKVLNSTRNLHAPISFSVLNLGQP